MMPAVLAMLDNYVYDTQFLFLKEDEALQLAYKEQVLKMAVELQLGENKVYVRTEQWDSQKFDRTTGRVVWLQNSVSSEVQQFDIVEGLRNMYECCYLRLNQNHSFCKFSKKNNLPVLSAKVSQHIDLGANSFWYEEGDLFEYTKDTRGKENILEEILKLSERSFRNNRFRADKHFSETEVNDIYRSWIVNEIKSNSSRLFVSMVNNSVAAFFLYKENISPLSKYKIGFVSLIASSPEYKEKNYGTNLLNFVLNKAKQQNTEYVIANTETKNESAVSFFKKNNFIVTSYLNEYHLWS